MNQKGQKTGFLESDALSACSSPRFLQKRSGQPQPNVGAGLVPARVGAGRTREPIELAILFPPLYSGEARRGFSGLRDVALSGYGFQACPHIDNHLDCLDASP